DNLFGPDNNNFSQEFETTQNESNVIESSPTKIIIAEPISNNVDEATYEILEPLSVDIDEVTNEVDSTDGESNETPRIPAAANDEHSNIADSQASDSQTIIATDQFSGTPYFTDSRR